MNSPCIAVLLTCFNRKEETLKCLDDIFHQIKPEHVTMGIFLVDDGSTDGTSEAIRKLFPEVHLITGNGSLFWAGGMRLAWNTALQAGAFDYFWLVNDDTTLYKETLSNLLKADEYALKTFGKNGVYVGSTLDPKTRQHSYGGQRLIRKKDSASRIVYPNGMFQSCEFCNANILLIPKLVVDQLGIFSEKYIHAIADYDYSMRAVRAGFPVLILPEYGGECADDHFLPPNAPRPSLEARIRNLYSPKGFSYKEYLHFIRTYFPSTYVNTVITLWIRTLFPDLWAFYKRFEKADRA
jgi:GT2 family glycosyltransferase